MTRTPESQSGSAAGVCQRYNEETEQDNQFQYVEITKKGNIPEVCTSDGGNTKDGIKVWGAVLRAAGTSKQ